MSKWYLFGSTNSNKLFSLWWKRSV